MSTSTDSVIVIADDFSETGMNALREGFRRAHGKEVHVVHVVTDADLYDAPGDTEMERQASVLETLPPRLWDRVAIAGEEVDDLPDTRVSVHIRLGRPSEAILQIAVDYDADMIVIGTHGRRGMQRLVLGSIAEALTRTARCPLLIARPKDYSGADRSERPDPAREGEDLHSQRPEPPHHYHSTRLMSWSKRDVETQGLTY